MPPYLQIPFLRDLALKTVANSIAYSAVVLSTYDRNSVEDIQLQNHYLSVLPPHIRSDILQCILSSDDLGTFVRFHALDVVLDGSVKTLTIGSFPESFYSKVLDTIADKGSSLETLDLKGVWIKGDDCCKLRGILKGLKFLKVLRIPHVATDEILYVISCYNKFLKILDVSGESPITRKGIEALCTQHHGVELLDIGRPGDEVILEPSTIALLLKDLPNLLSLGTYSYVGRALAFLVGNQMCSKGFSLKLRYLHDTDTDVSTINVIADSCPQLHSIYLDRPQKDAVLRLVRLVNLTKLKLSRFECNDMNMLLSQYGSRLQVLDLVIGRGIFDLSAVAEYCTKITNLTLYKVEHLVYFKQLPLPCLKKLNIYYATMSTSCMKYLISSSPKLEHLTLYYNFVVISDDLLKDVFSAASYPNLRTIWISNAPTLTLVGVTTMLEKCPNLAELGYLDTWGLSLEDIDLLHVQIISGNLDLYLVF